jgi:hypothetical protein
MKNEFDSGRDYPAKIIWKKARGFYDNAGLWVKHTVEDVLQRGVTISWSDLFLLKARLRAEIEDLQAEIRGRKKDMEGLEKITLQKVDKIKSENQDER